MKEIIFDVSGDLGYRPTEIISDLRIVAETMFMPMKMVGFWDFEQDMHLCPQLERRQPCPHSSEISDPDHITYAQTLQKERQSVLSISFPHAKITLFMA